MKRNTAALVERAFDVVIIGGGIFGICAAWNLIRCGLSVALIERNDFGHATSANHFKLIHGGLRYLQHLDVRRVRESSRERRFFLRLAPHMVHPVPFVVPTYGHGTRGKEIMIAALSLYELLTIDRNKGIADPSRRVPRSYLLSRAETLELFPHIPAQGLTGATVFHEVQMYNPARLSLSFLRSAVEAGADAANYVEAISFLHNGGRVSGVVARDHVGGADVEIRGRIVVNATGPWASRLLNSTMGISLEPEPMFSRDAYFVVNRPLLPHGSAVAVEGQTKDPDAVLSRGNRHLFMVPWRKYTLVGVWHVVYAGDPDKFTVTDDELDQFLEEINGACPGLALTRDDISLWNAGLTLFGENAPGQADLSYAKRSLVIDHAREHGIEGLLTLVGVRYTTAQGVGREIAELALRKLAKERTTVEPATFVHGGDVGRVEDALRDMLAMRPAGMDVEVMSALFRNYGSVVPRLVGMAEDNPAYAEVLGDSQVIGAQVVHAVREEMALRLDDVVFRRTDLGTGGHPGDAALQRCASLMASELDWSPDRAQKEVAEVRARFPRDPVVFA